MPTSPTSATGMRSTRRGRRRASDRFGRLDAVVAGAAVIAGGRPLWETPDGDLDLLWDIDVLGVWNTAAAAIPAMLAGPDPAGCRFVAVASAAGTRGLFQLAGYNASKHAVVGIVKGLAADLVGTGVTACRRLTRLDPHRHARRPPPTSTTWRPQNSFAEQQLVTPAARPRGDRRHRSPSAARPRAPSLNGSVVHADGGFHAVTAVARRVPGPAPR